MKAGTKPRKRGQEGFTLVELIIALAISLFVATALTSVVLSSVRASNIAVGRIEASSEIRAFQMRAYDDIAASSMPTLGACGSSQSNPCTTAPIVLKGVRASNSISPTISSATVTYTWDGSANLARQSGGSTTTLGTNVTGFSWYEDSTTNTVVIEMTVTVLSYSESQTFSFYPRLDS
jgi:prepilin-type N-terminal cleavage/methylation domain-containing protein